MTRDKGQDRFNGNVLHVQVEIRLLLEPPDRLVGWDYSQFSLAANALSGATQLSPTIIDRPSLSGKDDFGSCG